jgi:hypothetical protein
MYESFGKSMEPPLLEYLTAPRIPQHQSVLVEVGYREEVYHTGGTVEFPVPPEMSLP